MSNSDLCGCYIVAYPDRYFETQKQYLPLLESEVHCTILSTTSRIVLKQTFTNPSTSDPIKESIYTFPLYDGVSVVSFTCRIGKKVFYGLVKEKIKAKEIFDQAVVKGETTGLLEQEPQSADVFSTRIGNIPAGESVIVEITYIGELKYGDVDEIRFTIPTTIAPRYGSGPTLGVLSNSTLHSQDKYGIKITVDVNMPEGSLINRVQSPSHPIVVSIGTVSGAANADPTMSKASAALSLGSTALEKDFVLIVQIKDIGIPNAILETHPTISNHRAIMATLVPKFNLPQSRPEIVFVADRSGSMKGNISMLVSAMNVFLKSMPTGVKFNICSFGSFYSFLWPRSKSYTRETLEEATKHLDSFPADMGGTETFDAIKATVDRRFPDLSLEIMLITDGDIWQQGELFTYINQQVEKTKGNIRVFPLGIGNRVSHSLIEGLARAGNGFAQAVQNGDRLDKAVVRMLRGALSPHVTDYTIEVKYEQQDDDFEVVDRVIDGMETLISDKEYLGSSMPILEKPVISLFDLAAEPEKLDLKGLADSQTWLPEVPSPKILQAPHKIPSLFSFARTSVYLLMSPETIQRNPTAVVLRATSSHGPLKLEIPINSLSAPAKTIHQLAAKKAVQDLEEGRGWIYDAKGQHGILAKAKYPCSFDDSVEREAVRLCEMFQVAGKWCSFVAVAANDKEIVASEKEREEMEIDWENLDIGEELKSSVPPMCSSVVDDSLSGAISTLRSVEPHIRVLISDQRGGPETSRSSRTPGGMGLRQNSTRNPQGAFAMGSFGTSGVGRGGSIGRGGGIGRGGRILPPGTTSAERFPLGSGAMPRPVINPKAFFNRPNGAFPGGIARTSTPSDSIIPGSLRQQSRSLCGSSRRDVYQDGTNSNARVAKNMPLIASRDISPLQVSATGWKPHSVRAIQAVTNAAGPTSGSPGAHRQMDPDIEHEKVKATLNQRAPAKVGQSGAATAEKVLALIKLQDFEGYWSDAEECGQIIGVEASGAPKGIDSSAWLTLLVVKFLEGKCVKESITWGLVVDKARVWLEGLKLEDLEKSENDAGVALAL